MPGIRIDRFDDLRIQDYRNVSDAELLRRRGLFVAEGRLGVRRLLASGCDIVSLLLNDASFRALEVSLGGIIERTPVYICETSDFGSITGFNLHRGCLALARRPPERSAVGIADSSDLVLVLEGVTDASNVGSAFRNAAAFGAGAVFLSPSCCDPLYRKAIRTSMGSALQVPYARLQNWPADLDMLKSRGFALLALTPKESAIDLRVYAARQPNQSNAAERLAPVNGRAKLALMIGSEGPGLTPEAEAMADICLRIPIRADIDSLNLATAAGIALYCLGP